MIELFIVAALVTTALVAIGALIMAVLAVKLVAGLVLWPLRLLACLFVLPFLLLKWGIGLLVGLVAGVALLPILGVGLALALLAAATALLLPALPLLLVALLVWVVVRVMRPPLPAAP